MKTRLVFNDIIPFKGFLSMCLWPFIFVRNSAASRYSTVVNNHEHIHAEQQKEMLAVGLVLAAVLTLLGCGWWSLLAMPLFFWWYGIEWLILLVMYGDGHKAYRSLLVEREAYDHEKDLDYLAHRKRFAWLR
jgi:hypothetical protein